MEKKKVNFKFKKNDFVRVLADRYNIFKGSIDACGVIAGCKNYKVNGKWYFEKELELAKRTFVAPTNGQMIEIKKSYPILKKDNIKIIHECGHDTTEGFKGIFYFVYEKGDQKGKLRFNNGEFTIMSDKDARKYGW